MSRTSFGDRSANIGLRPMCRLEIEDYEIGEVGSMFVLTAEDEKLIPLVQGGGMAWIN